MSTTPAAAPNRGRLTGNATWAASIQSPLGDPRIAFRLVRSCPPPGRIARSESLSKSWRRQEGRAAEDDPTARLDIAAVGTTVGTTGSQSRNDYFVMQLLMMTGSDGYLLFDWLGLQRVRG